MAQFDQRVAEIQQAVLGLVETIGRADTAVGELDSRFTTLIGQAQTVSQLVSAIHGLKTAISSIDTETVNILQDKLALVMRAINQVDTGKITNLTTALERQSRVIADLAVTQDAINAAISTSKQRFSELKIELAQLAGSVAAVDTQVTDVGQKIAQMAFAAKDTKELQQLVETLANASAQMKPEVWGTTAEGLARISSAINKLDPTKLAALQSLAQSGSNISINISNEPKTSARNQERQRSNTPVPAQTAETKEVIVDSAGVVTTPTAAAKPATHRGAVYGGNVATDTMTAVAQLVHSNDDLITKLRNFIAVNTKTTPEHLDMVKVYEMAFKALNRPSDDRARSKALSTMGTYGFDAVSSHLKQIIDKVQSLPETSAETAATPRGVIAAQALYKTRATPVDTERAEAEALIYKTRRDLAEFNIKTQLPRATESETRSLIEHIARGKAPETYTGDGGDVSKSQDVLRYAYKQLERYFTRTPAAKLSSGEELGYDTESVRARAAAQTSPQSLAVSGIAARFESFNSGVGVVDKFAAGIGSTLRSISELPDKAEGLSRALDVLQASFTNVSDIFKNEEGALDLLMPVRDLIEQISQAMIALKNAILPTELNTAVDGFVSQIKAASDMLALFYTKMAAEGSVNLANVTKYNPSELFSILESFGRTAGVLSVDSVYAKNAFKADEPARAVDAEGLTPDEHLIRQNKGVTYTVGNGQLFANPQEFVNNMTAIERAVNNSANGIAVVGTTGTWDQTGKSPAINLGETTHNLDHALVAFRDAVSGQIKILEVLAMRGGALSADNLTGEEAFGIKMTGSRTPEHVAAEADAVAAVPVDLDKSTSLKFLAEFAMIQRTGQTYSFGSNGQQCASGIGTAFRVAGADDNLSLPIAGLNVTSPAQLIDRVRGGTLSNTTIDAAIAIDDYKRMYPAKVEHAALVPRDDAHKSAIDSTVVAIEQYLRHLEQTFTNVDFKALRDKLDASMVDAAIAKGESERVTVEQVAESLESIIERRRLLLEKLARDNVRVADEIKALASQSGISSSELIGYFAKGNTIEDAGTRGGVNMYAKQLGVSRYLNENGVGDNTMFATQAAPYVAELSRTLGAFATLNEEANKASRSYYKDTINQTDFRSVAERTGTLFEQWGNSGESHAGILNATNNVFRAISEQDIDALRRALDNLSLVVNDTAQTRMHEQAAQMPEETAPREAVVLAQQSAGAYFNAMQAATHDSMLNTVINGYKKFTTVTTNIGAILNSIRDFGRALKEVSIGTFLDVVRGTVKVHDAIKNIGAVFGASRPANTDRSSTLVDMADAGVRLYRKHVLGESETQAPTTISNVASSPKYRTDQSERVVAAAQIVQRDLLDKRKFRSTLTNDQEAARTELVLKLSADEDITVEDFSKIWKAKPSQKLQAELPGLLKELRAIYRKEVEIMEAKKILAEAEAEAAMAAHKAGSSQVNSLLEAPDSTLTESQLRAKRAISSLPESGIARVKRSEDAVTTLAGNTGLVGKQDAGYVVLSVDDAATVYKSIASAGNQKYAQEITGNKVAGYNAPVVAEGAAVQHGAYLSVGISKPGRVGRGEVASPGQVALHELTHAITERAKYSSPESGAEFAKFSELALRTQAAEFGVPIKDLETALKQNAEVIRDSATSGSYAKNAATVAASKTGYFNKPEELLSNVAMMHLSGDKEGEKTYRSLYGSQTYDTAVGHLERLAPNVFTGEGLSGIRSRYGAFNQQMTAEMSGGEPAAAPGRTLAQIKEEAIDAINKGIASGKEAIAADRAALQDLLQRGQTQIERVMGSSGDAGSGIQGAVKLIADFIRKLIGRVNEIIDKIAASLGDVSSLGGPEAAIQSMRVAAAGLETDLYSQLATLSGIAVDQFGTATQQIAFKSLSSEGLRGAVGQLASNPSVENIGPIIKEFNKVIAEVNHQETSMRESILSGEGVAGYVRARAINAAVNMGIDAATKFSTGTGSGIAGRVLGTTVPLSGGLTVGEVGARLGGQLMSESPISRKPIVESLNEKLRPFGDAVDISTVDVKKFYDLEEGITRISAEAKTARGEMVQFTGKLDAFGQVVEEVKEREDGIFAQFKQNLWRVPMEVLEQTVQNIAFAFMDLISQIVQVQDELAVVGVLLEKSGTASQDIGTAKADFLTESIKAANEAGQPFQEGIQTNIQNYKQLAAIQDPKVRREVSGQLSTLQLGAQTAFGLSLDESLNAVPAMYAQLNADVKIPDSMADASESDKQTYRAKIAIEQLTGVFNGLTVAQLESGAAGKDLVQVYAGLAASSKDAALGTSDLLSLAAVASVKLTGGPEEVNNTLKMLMERTYGEGSQKLQDLGIQTQEIQTDAQGNRVVAKRKFTDILADAARVREEQPNLSKQITTAMGSARQAPQALALLEGVSEQSRIAGTVRQVGPEGTQFMDIVTKQSQAFNGAMNKLQGSFGLFIERVLFGGSVMKDLSSVMEKASQMFIMLSTAITDHPEWVKMFEDVAKFIITGFVRSLTVGVNVAGVFAKALTMVSGQMRSFVLSFMQLGNVDQNAMAPLQKGAMVLAKSLDLVGKSARSAFNPMIVGANEAKLAADSATASINEMRVAQGGPVGGKSQPVAVAAQAARGYAEGSQGFWGTAPGAAIKGAGSFAGSMIAPVGMDLMMGGTSTDNIIGIGAGIAGGVAGFFAGGPGGSIIGYSLAKATADYLDVAGLVGTSKKEVSVTAQAFADAFKVSTPEGKADQEVKTDDAREALSRVEDVFNIGGIKAAYDDLRLSSPESNVHLGMGNEMFFGSSGGGSPVSSTNLRLYREQIVEGKDPGLDPGRLMFNLDYHTGYMKNVEAVYNKLKEAAPPEFLTAIENADFSNMNELFAIIEKMRDPTTAEGKEWIKIVDEMDAATRAQFGLTDAADGTGEAYVSLDKQLQVIRERLQQAKDAAEFMYNTPKLLTEYGALGSLQTGLREKYTSEITNIAGMPVSETSSALAAQATGRYERASASLGGIPGVLAIAQPLGEQLNQNIDYNAMTEMLYTGGAEVQSQFAQSIAPLVDMQKFVEDYQGMLEQISVIQSSVDIIGGNGPDKQAAAQAELDTLNKQTSARGEMYKQYLAYLSLVSQSPGLFMRELAAINAQNAARRKMADAQANAAQAPRFQLPSEVKVEDYTTEQLIEALNKARDKQDDIVKMFPEAAKEFKKQQFLLSAGDGQYKGVTGVNAAYFQDALREITAKITPPETLDLRDKSTGEIQRIIERARALQEQAVALAPDVAKDFEDKRLLLLGKNNEMLAATGVSQEYLRMAMDDNTKATENSVRGHYNLPGSYRPPTVWDYYNEGGKETGGNNFVIPGGLNDKVSLDFARQMAEKMLQNPEGTKAGPDLGAIGNTIDPNASPLGYPELSIRIKIDNSDMPPIDLPPGKQGKNVEYTMEMTPEQRRAWELYRSGEREDEPPSPILTTPIYPTPDGSSTGADAEQKSTGGTGGISALVKGARDFASSADDAGGAMTGAGVDVQRVVRDISKGAAGALGIITKTADGAAGSGALLSSALDIATLALTGFHSNTGNIVTALAGIATQLRGVNMASMFAQALTSGRIQIQVNGSTVKVVDSTGSGASTGGKGGALVGGGKGPF